MKKYPSKSVYEFLLKIQSIAKIGLLYSQDPYAIENYEELNALSKAFIEDHHHLNLNRPNVFPQTIYPTPNVSVRVILFNDNDEVLLVKEKVDGGYTIPGGWADLYETPAEAAIKECLQEAGAHVTLKRLVGVYAFNFKAHGQLQSQYALVFQGTVKGALQPFGHEITEVGYFPIHALPSPISKKIKKQDLLKMIMHAKKGVTYFE
jgi:8-oxo-dGTP diphosphatase